MILTALEYLLWALLVLASIANVLSWRRGPFLGLANIALMLLIYIGIIFLGGAQHL